MRLIERKKNRCTLRLEECPRTASQLVELEEKKKPSVESEIGFLSITIAAEEKMAVIRLCAYFTRFNKFANHKVENSVFFFQLDCLQGDAPIPLTHASERKKKSKMKAHKFVD